MTAQLSELRDRLKDQVKSNSAELARKRFVLGEKPSPTETEKVNVQC